MPTDKLFTGQRLDSTGLYYYNARYYDASIGRFISPDSIVQNYGNPQMLNRYTYCLNNPLKYTDPSGHIVTINGYDINQCLSTGDYMALLMVCSSSIFHGYLDFRSIDPVLSRSLETSERVIDIAFGNTKLRGSRFTPESIFTKNGNDRTIIINADNSGADSFWLAGQIYKQATNFVDIYPPLFSQETGYDLLGFVPAGKAIRTVPNIGRELAKLYALTQATFGFSDSISEATRFYGNGMDAAITAVSTALSVSPAWLLGAGMQLSWDFFKAGNQFYDDAEKRGGVYQFKP